MDSSTQETLHNDPQWFFKYQKEDILQSIKLAVGHIMLRNKDFFNQVEMDDELLKLFLCANKDVMQMYLSSSQPNHTPLSRAQKKSTKKKLKKLQRQQQQQDENPFIVPRRPSPEQTSSGSKVVTFNNVPPQQETSSKSSDNIKPSEQSTIIPDKKRKQEHLADNFNNSNLILTGYCPQQEEQAQLLDLIVYDIPAKWDSYTLLGNLSFWGKIVSISTRCHKKYLSAKVRLISNHECLKAYNGGEWTVGLSGILVRWFPASWNLSERKQRDKFQAVITDIPADMTESTLFPNSTPSKFVAESGMKSFKVIKESSGQRKLIGYFATWDQASKCISTPQLWNDVSFSWCRYSSPKLGFKKHPPARFGNAGNKNTRQLKPSRQQHTNLDNHRCHNQNKKENSSSNSGSTYKKNSRFKSNQSNRPDVKHLIAGLKALLDQFI
ncbi:hypothetical protein RclHR1_25810001 [Rhizophagus clarus]|uniref:Uncharacterized protein n=1 Tax=Rhizophagus clarus TaxID=94130 RepID=A0A2Z6R119_9GLOM|nr:hypothetical protein RclHR1_25810001 [Rhizophagus clarus]